MLKLLLIGLGGAAGTVLRYGFVLVARRATGDTAFGTLVVNVLGCFILGLLAEAVLRGARVGEDLRLALSVGFCGGLTTYSSFNQEALGMLRAAHAGSGVLYVAATVVLCALASLLGLALARALVSPAH